jgi:hypothetical protein
LKDRAYNAESALSVAQTELARAKEQATERWQSIETAPKDGGALLLGYRNALGNWRTVRGQWFSDEQIKEEWEDGYDSEEGWYETSVEADDLPNCWPVNPTHWQPLPEPPVSLLATAAATNDTYDLIAHLHRQRAFSLKNFGPGERAEGVVAHIRKELEEIEADPKDLEEWVDVVLLALDGAWRSGNEPEQIAEAINAKLTKNENRQWPNWKEASSDAPIEHIRSEAAATIEAKGEGKPRCKCNHTAETHSTRYCKWPDCRCWQFVPQEKTP